LTIDPAATLFPNNTFSAGVYMGADETKEDRSSLAHDAEHKERKKSN